MKMNMNKLNVIYLKKEGERKVLDINIISRC